MSSGDEPDQPLDAAGSPFLSSTGWRPANAVERAMVDALTRGDHRRYFELVGVTELLLPAFSEDSDEYFRQRFVAMEMCDLTYLPVFTSVESLVAFLGNTADAYNVTSYEELRQKWPVPDWRIAVNPGTPIDAYLPIDSVAEAAAGELTVPTIAEALASASTEASPSTDQDARRMNGKPRPSLPGVSLDG